MSTAASASERLFPLSAAGRARAARLYAQEEAFFPLIAATLSGAQTGAAFGDDADNPTQAYAEHCFGFAQMFGQITTEFETSLAARLLRAKNFAPAKIRLYTPHLPEFLSGAAGAPFRSERGRFHLDRAAFARLPAPRHIARRASAEDMDAIEKTFGLTTRFWPDQQSFLQNARAAVVVAEAQPAAICYAAALANNRAEIDILTTPDKRGQGLGLAAGIAFVSDCLTSGIEPLWDCFTNNAGSLALAAKLGFAPARPPYQFYTIPRQ